MKTIRILFFSTALLTLFLTPDLTEASLSFKEVPNKISHHQSLKKSHLRIVTFNLFHSPWNRQIRLQHALDLLKQLNPDVIALQEVASGLILPGDPMTFFSQSLSMDFVFQLQQNKFWLYQTGLSILSKIPMKDVQSIQFSKHPLFDAKGFMFLKLETVLGPLGLINVHLASTNNQKMKQSEFNELGNFILKQSVNSPLIVLGDFNEDFTTPLFQEFYKKTQGDSLFAHLPAQSFHNTWSPSTKKDCSDSAGERIDTILKFDMTSEKKISFRGGGVIVPTAQPHPSDHCPVLAEIELNLKVQGASN